MARLPHNVERYRSQGGYRYTGYDAGGFAFRLYKVGKSWWAKPSHLRASIDNRMFTNDTLEAVGKRVGASYWVPPSQNAEA